MGRQHAAVVQHAQQCLALRRRMRQRIGVEHDRAARRQAPPPPAPARSPTPRPGPRQSALIRASSSSARQGPGVVDRAQHDRRQLRRVLGQRRRRGSRASPAPRRSAARPVPPAAPRRPAPAPPDRTSAWPWSYLCAAAPCAAPGQPRPPSRSGMPVAAGRSRAAARSERPPAAPQGPARRQDNGPSFGGGRSPSESARNAVSPSRRPLSASRPAGHVERDDPHVTAPAGRLDRRVPAPRAPPSQSRVSPVPKSASTTSVARPTRRRRPPAGLGLPRTHAPTRLQQRAQFVRASGRQPRPASPRGSTSTSTALLQQPRHDEAVAAVVARPAERRRVAGAPPGRATGEHRLDARPGPRAPSVRSRLPRRRDVAACSMARICAAVSGFGMSLGTSAVFNSAQFFTHAAQFLDSVIPEFRSACALIRRPVNCGRRAKWSDTRQQRKRQGSRAR